MPSRKHRRTGRSKFILGAFLLAGMPASAADLSSSERALMQGRAADAVTSLHAALSANPNDGQAHLLLCRVFYAEQMPDQAASECGAALSTLGGNSLAQDWAGKAYGLKADRSGVLSGFSLAKKVRAAFEAAVNLDPDNGEAVDDLGEYYVQAPSIVGGGTDKASALAARVQGRHPLRALRIQGMIAEKQKDYAAAERQFRARVETSGGRADTWVDLGDYYGRRNDLDRAVDALHHAYAANKSKDPSLVSLAVALNKIGREPDLAVKALQDYLNGRNWDDTAPTFKAHMLLAKLLAGRGDKATAKIELQKALALAPDYQPARKALASL